MRDEKNDDEIFGELEYESRNTVISSSVSIIIVSVGFLFRCITIREMGRLTRLLLVHNS